MAQPDPYAQDPGYHAPPPGHAQQPSPPQPDAGYQDYNAPPQHAAYDPKDGRPIPPGYVPPHAPPPSSYDPHNFPPPPREEYGDDYQYGQGSPSAQHDRGYDQGPPRSDHDRGYDRAPPSDYHPDRQDLRGYDENQLTPYDDEKAEAEWRRGYEDQQGRYGPPPPPSDYDLERRRGQRRDYDDRDRRYDDRYDDRDRYDSRDRDRYRDDRDRRSDERNRRDSRSQRSPTSKKGPDIFGGKEGDRGLGAQILGGAAGGLLGHEMGKGWLETLGGAIVGVVGAKALENQHDKYKTRKAEQLKSGAPFADEAMTGRRRRGDDRDYGRDSRDPPRRRDDDRDYDRDSRDPPRRRDDDRGSRGPPRSTSRRQSSRRSRSRSRSYSDESRSPPPRR